MLSNSALWVLVARPVLYGAGLFLLLLPAIRKDEFAVSELRGVGSFFSMVWALLKRPMRGAYALARAHRAGLMDWRLPFFGLWISLLCAWALGIFALAGLYVLEKCAGWLHALVNAGLGVQ